MRTFRYFPPGADEQRAFVMLFVGTLLGLAAIGALLWFVVREEGRRAILWGAGAALVWSLGRAAWRLEKKAQRSANAEISVGDDGLHLSDEHARSVVVAWDDLTFGVVGGRMALSWPDGKLEVGAREIEDGMELMRAIGEKKNGPARPGFTPPSNFIPLDPA